MKAGDLEGAFEAQANFLAAITAAKKDAEPSDLVARAEIDDHIPSEFRENHIWVSSATDIESEIATTQPSGPFDNAVKIGGGVLVARDSDHRTQLRQAAVELFGVVESAVRGDPTLGGICDNGHISKVNSREIVYETGRTEIVLYFEVALDQFVS